MTGLDVLAWNAHLGNRRVAKVLTRLVKRNRPHVVVLNEVPHQHGALRTWAKVNGYVMFAESPGDRSRRVVSEHGSTVVLVDDDNPALDLVHARVVTGKESWRVVRYDRVHAPRRDWVVRLRLHGVTYRVFASHVATNGLDGPNRRAVAEWLTRADRAVRRRRRGVVLVDVGDHNNSVRALRRWLPANVAGHGPDSAVVAGGVVSRRVLPKYGSDHRAIRYHITPREKQ